MNATLYTYHGIQYTYADLQAAYRRQQAETHKAIDCGNYRSACDINNKDVREYLPQMTAPERSGTTRQQKSDKKTLTAPQKCGIIQSIKRIAQKIRREKP
jgi:hypothetical protein